MSAPARRGLLAAMGGVALAAPSLFASPAQDAPLIAWCARFAGAEDDYEAAIRPFPDGKFPPDVDAHLDALWAEECDLLARINATPARTPAGWVAKAKVALRLALDGGYDAERTEEVTTALLRDLAGADPGFLAAHDGTAKARHAAFLEAVAAREAREAAAPPPEPEPVRDLRTPEQRVEGARRMARIALSYLRDVKAELRAAAVVAS